MPQIVSTILSLVLYVVVIFVMKNIIHGIELFSIEYFPATIIIVILAWGPPFLYEIIRRWLDPTE
jgi:membrane protein required for beta-lactamase induction